MMENGSSATGPVYVIDGVSKTYPGGVVALSPISLEINAGERVALLGPSGSGKTTFLHLLGGMVAPDSGEILVEGRPLATFSPGAELASLVGIIHQQLDLVPQLPAIHNVLAGRLGSWSLFHSLTSLVWPRERSLAMEAMTRVGIGDKLNARTSQLSGGEQQRVALARLLVQRPKVILADEPVASLDPARAEDLMRLLTGIAEESGNPLVASLHSVRLARTYFTRAIGLRNGSLEFDLPVGALQDPVLDSLYELEGLRDGVETATL